jgi:predicted ATP-grasp superfamily ATP-dependent carboligase
MIHSADELARALERLANYSGDLMLCEFIPGPDTCGANYNSFCIDGRPVQEFTAQKVRLRPTAIGFPTVVHSRRIPPVLDAGRRMIAALGYNGFSCMEFKLDLRDGIYKLMEVNGRHNYSGCLASACGIDFPWLSYLAACDVTLPVAAHNEIPEIFWIDEERDMRAALPAFSSSIGAARSWLEPYRGAHVYAVLSRSDLMPSLNLAGSSVLRKIRE